MHVVDFGRVATDRAVSRSPRCERRFAADRALLERSLNLIISKAVRTKQYYHYDENKTANKTNIK